MVAEGYAFVVCPDHNVHGVVFALVISVGHGALPIAAFLVVQHQLVIVVANAGILAVEGCPGGINSGAFLAFQFQVGTPVLMYTPRYCQSRLKQSVVDVHTQLALLYDGLPTEGNAVAHALYCHHILSVG